MAGRHPEFDKGRNVYLRSPDYPELATVFQDLALAAGRRIMEIFRVGCEVGFKADASPVTQADREAEEIIVTGLRARYPGVALVAEEEAAAGVAPSATGEAFFLVDPLDGTREFVSRNADFTVNIALIDHGEPVVGVVYAPARHLLYKGHPGHSEAVSTDPEHRPRETRVITARMPQLPPVVVASRSHCTAETEAYIARLGPVEWVSVGSSLKFCLIASGEADLYPRLGPTMQWDTAAGDAVLRAAGGMTRTLDGHALTYGANVAARGGYANPSFVASGAV